jgi:flavin-binding protein dodecin
MPDDGHVYKLVELVGSSPQGIDAAIENAVARAAESLTGLDWFEVREIRGRIEGGAVGWYQVRLGVGFRVEDGSSLSG